jgi:hypothetical protein
VTARPRQRSRGRHQLPSLFGIPLAVFLLADIVIGTVPRRRGKPAIPIVAGAGRQLSAGPQTNR